MVECYPVKLGNAWCIFIGQAEIAKFWFNTEDQSKSILSEEEAKEMAENMSAFFNDKYDMSKFEGEFSEEEEMMMKLLSKIMCE